MRVTNEQAQANRRRVVETAAELFRDRGFDGISVADLMKASGFTHGGFYRQFPSKDGLIAEATGVAYEQLERETAGKSIDDLLIRYISPEHRDDLATGCPTTALGGSAMRQADEIRTVFATGVGTWIGMIGDTLAEQSGASDAECRAMATQLAAQAVGAIVLARAASADPSLSDGILDASLSGALTAARSLDGGSPE